MENLGSADSPLYNLKYNLHKTQQKQEESLEAVANRLTTLNAQTKAVEGNLTVQETQVEALTSKRKSLDSQIKKLSQDQTTMGKSLLHS